MTTLISTGDLVPMLETAGTYSVQPGVPVPTTGYVVALAGLGQTFTDWESFWGGVEGPLWQWVRKARELAAWHNGYLGSWTDPDTGMIYLDVVRVLQSRAEALELAESTGELAIWDLAASDAIFTPTGKVSHGIFGDPVRS